MGYSYHFLICRQLIFAQQQSLRKSLIDEQDPAMALHAIVVLLFQRETGTVIHMPGKLVPAVISFLCQYLLKREHGMLVEAQQLITAKWKTRQLDSDIKSTENEGANVPSNEDSAISADGISEEDRTEALIQDLKQFVVANR